jgi:Pentapeptide repeats (9 copies)
MTPKETVKPKRTPKAKEAKEKPICFISDKCNENKKADVRNETCQHLKAQYEGEDGNFYCVLHFPSDNKDNFKYDFIEKVESGQNNFQYTYFPAGSSLCIRIFPTEIDFSCATFASEASLDNLTFKKNVTFSHATFLGSVKFGMSEFESVANFDSAVFLGETNFNSAKFKGQTSFDDAVFDGKTDFHSAEFTSSALFHRTCFNKNTDFTCANFSLVEFQSAIFNSPVYFTSVQFKEQVDFMFSTFFDSAHFSATTFYKNAFFNFSKFKENSRIYFNQTVFKNKISFVKTEVVGYLIFEGGEREVMRNNIEINEGITECFVGKDSILTLENSLVEKPNRISFHTVRLRPNWFINVDSRSFVFTNIDWENSKGRMERVKNNVRKEVKLLKERKVNNPERLFTIACRQLSVNAEENNRFEEASNFRKMSMEAERERRKVDKEFDVLHRLYRILSVYGEDWFLAFYWLFTIWILFAFGYTILGEFGTTESLQRLEFWKSLGYSLFVMTLQKPEPRPFSTITYILYGLETILAPLQAALLALAIRRKFMR